MGGTGRDLAGGGKRVRDGVCVRVCAGEFAQVEWRGREWGGARCVAWVVVGQTGKQVNDL